MSGLDVAHFLNRASIPQMLALIRGNDMGCVQFFRAFHPLSFCVSYEKGTGASRKETKQGTHPTKIAATWESTENGHGGSAPRFRIFFFLVHPLPPQLFSRCGWSFFSSFLVPSHFQTSNFVLPSTLFPSKTPVTPVTGNLSHNQNPGR